MSEMVYRLSEEKESIIRQKSGLSNQDFDIAFEALEQKRLVKRQADSKLSAAPSAFRRADLSMAQYDILYAILHLEMVDREHPLIAVHPGIMNGRPHIAGTRIAVENISTLYELGQGRDEIQQGYPHLTYDDIDLALRFYFDRMYPVRVKAG